MKAINYGNTGKLCPLILNVLNRKNGNIRFQIPFQAYRCNNFFKGKDFFRAENGVCLVSSLSPLISRNEFDDGIFSLYVCGEIKSTDDTVLTCSSNEYSMIREAVKEYNRNFIEED